MPLRTLAFVVVMLMVPAVAHADLTVERVLQECKRVNNCERHLSIAAAITSNIMRPNDPEPDRACLPIPTPDKVTFDLLTNYFNQHPERAQEPFYKVVQQVVADYWPCPPAPPRPPGPKTFEVLGCRGGVCGAERRDGSIDPRP